MFDIKLINMKKRSLVWFRQDLRLLDNEAIVKAMQQAEEVIFCYVFDERTFKGKTRWFGFPKTGVHRAKFVIDAVADLQRNLEKLGAKLLIRIGKPEDEVATIAKAMQCSWVFCNKERTEEEVNVELTLEKKLWSMGIELRFSRGKMLLHTQDLPFPVNYTPDVFTQFRKEVEKVVEIREPYDAPTSVATTTSFVIPIGELPTLEDLGYEVHNDYQFIFHGGEQEGLKRLQYYLWDTHLIKQYKETRNGLLGQDYSSKLSPYLAQGCLSPKTIYYEIKKYETTHGANESTYWLFFELLWRDFFRLMGKKYGNKIFFKTGIANGRNASHLKNDVRLFELWKNAKTGIPFIDANMTELAQTGFMSNRGRQNVASFLVKDLMVNWQMGAEYFESQLVDYDVTSNWGNWNYVAGVGADPRENRYFNILRQAKMYDCEGRYVKHWLAPIATLPEHIVHQPDAYAETLEKDFHIVLGLHYPKAIINTKKWEK